MRKAEWLYMDAGAVAKIGTAMCDQNLNFVTFRSWLVPLVVVVVGQRAQLVFALSDTLSGSWQAPLCRFSSSRSHKECSLVVLTFRSSQN